MPRARTVLLLTAASLFAGSGVARADPDTTPPSVSVRFSFALTGTQVVGFSEPVRNVTAGNVLLRVSGTTAPLASVLVCRDAGGAATDCLTGDVTVVDLRPRAPLVSGQLYEIAVNPDGAAPVVDTALNAAPKTVRILRASVREQETSAGATYLWRSYTDASAYGGSYRSERTADARAVFRFSGTSVTWYTRVGPNQGLASVWVDGVQRARFSNYAATARMRVRRLFDGLAPGRHVLVVRVLGQKGSPAGTGTWVSVDAFRVGSAPDVSEAVEYRWLRVARAAASGEYVARAQTVGASVSFRFRGRGIDWFTVIGPHQGTVGAYVDDVLVRTYDDYAATTRFGVRRTVLGLTDAEHVLRLVVAGRNARAADSWLNIDRWVLRAGTSDFRRLGAWVDFWDYSTSTGRDAIASTVAAMRSHGVRTLFLETGSYRSGAFKYPTQVGYWLEEAHAAGVKVVGWYFPAYGPYLDTDVAQTAAIATFRSPAGHRFEALAIDIEYRGETSSRTEFMDGIAKHLARVRSRVGLVFPVGAITFAPLDMDICPTCWEGFPWWAVGRYADVVLPMNYWSHRLWRCEDGQLKYCPYEFARQNIVRARANTGLPVNVIGGIANKVTASQTADYVRAARDARALGGGLYDYRTTPSALWPPLGDLNSL